MTFVFFLDSIEQEQFALFGYSLGNMGLMILIPLIDVIVRCEHISTIVESKKNESVRRFLLIFL